MLEVSLEELRYIYLPSRITKLNDTFTMASGKKLIRTDKLLVTYRGSLRCRVWLGEPLPGLIGKVSTILGPPYYSTSLAMYPAVCLILPQWVPLGLLRLRSWSWGWENWLVPPTWKKPPQNDIVQLLVGFRAHVLLILLILLLTGEF